MSEEIVLSPLDAFIAKYKVSTFTPQELCDAVNAIFEDESFDTLEEIAWNLDCEDSSAANKFIEEIAKEVDSTGGEDQGSDASYTYHFPREGVYLKISGHYASYHGYDWDDPYYIAQPVNKVITVYEKV